MARVPTCNIGWESGNPLEGGSLVQSGGGSYAVATSPTPIYGIYSLSASISNTNWAQVGIKYPLTATKTEGYFRVRVNLASGSYDNPALFFKVLDESSNVHLALGWFNSNDLIRFYRGDAAVLLATASAGPTYASWALLKGYVKIDAVAGRFQLYHESNLIVDYTGNTKGGAGSYAGYCWVGCHAVTASGRWASFYFDDLAWNDPVDDGTPDTGLPNSKGFVILMPNGNGNYSDLTGSDGNKVDNYALVDEKPPSSADYVGSATATEKDSYALENLSATYTKVMNVQPVAYSGLAAAGTGGLKTLIRSNGTDDTDASSQALTTTYASIRGEIRHKNPDGDVDWTVTAVNAAEVGMEVV